MHQNPTCFFCPLYTLYYKQKFFSTKIDYFFLNLHFLEIFLKKFIKFAKNPLKLFLFCGIMVCPKNFLYYTQNLADCPKGGIFSLMGRAKWEGFRPLAQILRQIT